MIHGWVRAGTRRAALLTVVLAASLTGGACTGGDDMSTAQSTQPDDQPTLGDVATVPDPGSTEPDTFDLTGGIQVALASPPTALDPHRTKLRGDNPYIFMAYDRLTEMSNNLQPAPMLATEWSYADDGSAFDMTLRDDVVFHDGTPFDADAVVVNIERAKTIEESVVAAPLEPVQSVEALDPTHVRFHLEGGPSNLPHLLSGLAGAMISPAVIDDPSIDLNNSQIDGGAGPYRLTDWAPGEVASFTRADNYWDPDRQRAGGITLRYIGDPQDRFDRFQAGELDVVPLDGELVTDAISLGDTGAFYYLPQTLNTVHGMWLNPSVGDLQSLEIRQAINHAIDRNHLVDVVLDGQCENRVQTFPLGSTYYYPEIELRYPYDQDKARSLVAESGIENPTFDALVPVGVFLTMATAFQEQLAEVGITMNIIETETPGEAAVAYATGEAAATLIAIAAYSDPAQLLDQFYFRIGLPMLDDRADEYRQRTADAESLSLTTDQRIEAYRGILSDIHEQAGFVAACATDTVWAWQTDIVGVDSMPNLWQGTVAPYTIGRRDE